MSADDEEKQTDRMLLSHRILNDSNLDIMNCMSNDEHAKTPMAPLNNF